MQIAGVYTDKARRGDPKEFSPDEKAPRAVKKALADKFTKDGFSATPTDVTVTSLSYQKKGDPLKKSFQNNRYEVAGTVRFFLRDMERDITHEQQLCAYTLSFEDMLDDNGLPEFKIVDFKVDGQ